MADVAHDSEASDGFMLARTVRNALAIHSKCRPRTRNFVGHRLNYSSQKLGTASVIPASQDDLTLKSVFDTPLSRDHVSFLSPTGLFGHSLITQPNALISLADATIVRAQLLTDRIVRSPESRTELFKVVKNLDRLSDLLCGVIDLTELVRNAHPDEMWVNAANHAYELLCEFMNVLNTNVNLYNVRYSLFWDGSNFQKNDSRS